MKILIIGCNGQLGHDASQILSPEHDVWAVDVDVLDITDESAVKRAFDRYGPAVVINCAAYTDVDGCERHEAAARQVNVDGPRHLADAAAACGAMMVHVSTDYVFDGQRTLPVPYRESDAPGPVSVYGKTKLAGELAVLESGARCAVVRTAWLYGINGRNFLKTILRLALRQPEQALKVVDDQYGSPTWSYRLAQQVGRVIETGLTGMLHATAEGYCSWHELAACFLSAMNVAARLVPCKTEEFPRPAPRPHNSILENSRLKAAGVNLMRPWAADVDEFVERHRTELLAEAHEEG